ncbi:SH3 domain-containing protein [Streptomyces sp. NPDC005925]|uniref:SH3 domain-containing protein n=1 Tax=Streptomyces sp. NPDC005925 TaxID=3157172 RepID=UPI0033DFA716
MSLRSRLAIAAAAGVLAATAATPAVAHADWGNGTGSGSRTYDSDDTTNDNGTADGTGMADSMADDPGTADATGDTDTAGQAPDAGAAEGTGAMGGDGSSSRYYRGVVTASTLLLRSAPNRNSQIIRYAHRGDIVNIYCKTGGETIDGNPLWYLLPDGTWAWGAARYIDNIGPAPRWC